MIYTLVLQAEPELMERIDHCREITPKFDELLQKVIEKFCEQFPSEWQKIPKFIRDAAE